jgi:hypothetical protein
MIGDRYSDLDMYEGARQRVERVAGHRGSSPDPGQVEDAARLLVAWWRAAEQAGIRMSVLDCVVDQADSAYDAVLARDIKWSDEECECTDRSCTKDHVYVIV